MRVLLVGELSGFHANLKDGLTQLGVEAVVAGTGDGFKKIRIDIKLLPERNDLKGKIEKYILSFLKVRKLKDYDVVQFISPFIFTNKIIFNKIIYKKLIKYNKKAFLVATGTDAVFWQIGRKRCTKYNSLDDYKRIDLHNSKVVFERTEALKWNIDLAERVHGIIPSQYEYSLGYKDFNNICPIIPQPINTKKILYQENNVKKKIRIFHGISRPGFKGSKYILEAFKIIKTKYPNDVDIIILKRLPYNEYIKALSITNVVVDQTNSYSYGMNALIAMSMGKIVMGGSEPEALKALGIKRSPIINIKPDPIQIAECLMNLIRKKDCITELGKRSRNFVEKTHDSQIIAKEYLKVWSR